MPRAASLFITFEGGEGSGKTTQIRALEARLVARGHRVTTTLEPGGGTLGKAVRRILLDPRHAGLAPVAELGLIAASRAQHVRELIRPALEEGHIVLCDRFHDSTAAYQGGGRGLEGELIDRLNTAATGGLEPDLTVLLDLPVEIGLARARGRDRGAAARDQGRFEAETLAFHRRVRREFRARARRFPERIRRIDATREVAAVERGVNRAVDRAIAALLESRD